MCSVCGELKTEVTCTTRYADDSPPETFPPGLDRLVDVGRTHGELAAVAGLAVPIGRGADLLRCPECDAWFERSDRDRALQGGPEYDVETTIARITPAAALFALDENHPERPMLLARVEAMPLDAADSARLYCRTDRFAELRALLEGADASAIAIVETEAGRRPLPPAVVDVLVSLIVDAGAGEAASKALWMVARFDATFSPWPLCVHLDHPNADVRWRAARPLRRHFENRIQSALRGRGVRCSVEPGRLTWAIEHYLKEPYLSAGEKALRAFCLEDPAAYAVVRRALEPHRRVNEVGLLLQQLAADRTHIG